MTRNEILALAKKAGVLPHEMREDSEHGLLISAAGFRKMAALAPDQEHASALLKRYGADVASILKIGEKDV